MKKPLIIICCFYLPSILGAQQISNYLYNTLPKEYCPTDRQHVTLPELSNMMKNAKWRIINDDKAIKELDTLCIRFALEYVTIPNKKDRLEFLVNLSSYWVGRADNYCDSMLKYSLLFDKETKDGIKGFEKLAGAAAIREAIAYAAAPKKDYEKAYQCIVRALDIFHQIRDSVQLCKSCLQLTGIYTALGLYKKAGEYLDSSNKYDTKAKNLGIESFRFTYSSALFLKQYAEKSEDRFADSLNKIINQYSDTDRYPEMGLKYAKSDLYFTKAQFNYYQKKYQLSLKYIDSVYRVLDGFPPGLLDGASHRAFKGLTLMQLGKAKEGIAILESVQPNMDDYNTGMMLEAIYNYEKKKGHLAKALEYHEKMMAFNTNEQQLKHQGQLLEMEQQYNVAARDLQIARLRAQQERIKYFILLISFFILALIGFFVNRQRNSKHNTQKLLSKIDELTQMQIIRIEEAAQEAEEKERKRIGQELHDELSGSLAGVLHFLRGKTSRETNPVEKADMEKACSLLESSYEKTRLKSHDIYYRENNEQFATMLANNVNLFFTGTGIKVEAEIDHIGIDELSSDVKTNILLIIKEAVTNIIKHARASKVDLLLYNSNGSIYVEVGDDGIGPTKNLAINRSLGLKSIKERIEKSKGHFDVGPRATRGTLIKVMLPAIIADEG